MEKVLEDAVNIIKGTCREQILCSLCPLRDGEECGVAPSDSRKPKEWFVSEWREVDG